MKSFIISIVAVFIILFSVDTVIAQTIVRGSVNDKETGVALAGASVVAQDSSVATSTNSEGEFQLTVPQGVNKITVGILGYTSQTIAVPGDNAPLHIMLEPSALLMNEVVLESFLSDRKLLNATASTGMLTEKDFQRNNTVFLQNSLNTIPGVRMNMRSVTSQSNILIRGIGTYSRFSIRGIKMYLNGIPLSEADGTTNIDDIDNTMLGRAEVIKGPASSVYGATLGGTVLFQTAKAGYHSKSINQSVMVGSYGLFRSNTGISLGTDKVNLVLNYGHQELQGYRSHSASKKHYVTAAGDFYLSQRQTLSVLFNYARISDKYAGELDAAQVAADRTQANQNYVRKNIGVEQTQLRLGVSHTYHFSSKLSNTTSVFTGATSQENPIEPFYGTGSRNRYGARSVFSYASSIGGIKTRFHAGSELIANDNLNKKYSWSKNFLDSSIISDMEVKASQFNLFAQGEADLTKNTVLTLGASYNLVHYQIIDRFNNHNDKLNLSGNMDFTPVITPRAAIAHTFSEKVTVYANASAGFSPPTSDQISLPDGTVNKDLKAERAVSYEVGTRGNLLKNRLTYGVSLFSMTLNNLLVPSVQNKFTIYTNAARSANQGVELQASYTLVSDSVGFVRMVRPFASYTYNHFEFKNYTKGGIDYSGNKVPGVFPNIFTGGLDVQLKYGIYFYGTTFYNDKMPLQDNNQASYKAYWLFNLKAGVRGTLLKHLQYDLFAGMDNASNTYYSASLALNGGASIYNPAYPRNYYGGIALRYLF